MQSLDSSVVRARSPGTLTRAAVGFGLSVFAGCAPIDRAPDPSASADAERRIALAERTTYLTNVESALHSHSRRERDRVRTLLDASAASPFLNWEWRWLNAESDESELTLRGHGDAIVSASFSPDGTRIVTASSDHTARVWDANTGTELAVLRGHSDGLSAVALSPDGQRVFTSSADGTTRIWDATSGQEIQRLQGKSTPASSILFKRDGSRMILTSNGRTPVVWDALGLKPMFTLRGHTDWINLVAFGASDTRIITGSQDRTARIWDAANGQQLAVLEGHEDSILSAELSPDGTRALTAALDGTVRLWDAATGQQLVITREPDGRPASATFSPDGARVLTFGGFASPLPVRICDASTLRVVREIRHTNERDSRLNSAMFLDGGARVLTVSDDGVRIFDSLSGDLLSHQRGSLSYGVRGSLSSDGSRLITEDWRGTARVWNIPRSRDPNVLVGHLAEVCFVSFSPDGTRIVTASEDHTARVWDTTTGRCLAILRGHEAGLRTARFNSDGTVIVTASMDGTARLWSAFTGRPLAVFKDPDPALELAPVDDALFSADCLWIATLKRGGPVSLWRVSDSAAPTFQVGGHERRIVSVAVSDDGSRLLTAGEDRAAKLWDTRSGQQLAAFASTQQIFRVLFDHQEPRLVTSARGASRIEDRFARLIDPARDVVITELRGLRSYVGSFEFNPDRSRVVTTDGGGRIVLWDAPTGTRLGDLPAGASDATYASFSPDGTRIVLALSDGTARILDSVPRRERLGALETARQAEERVEALIRERLGAGETLAQIREAVALERTMPWPERAAHLAQTLQMLESDTD